MLDLFGVRARQQLVQAKLQLAHPRYHNTLFEERLRDCMRALAESRAQVQRLTGHNLSLEADLRHTKADVERLQMKVVELEKEKRACDE